MTFYHTVTIIKNMLAQSLAQILLENKKISPEDLKKIKYEMISSGLGEEEIIIKEGLVSEEDLARARSQIFSIPYVNLVEKGAFPEALSIISKSVAERFTLIPFAFEQKTNTLSVAMADPLNLEAIEFLERKYDLRVAPYIATRSGVEKAIMERYAQSLAAEVKAALKEVKAPVKLEAVDVRKLGTVIKETSNIVKIVTTILEFAMKSRASDIHLEPQEVKSRVRYRIDGILHEKLILPKDVHEALVSRIKILGGMKIDEKRVPQDGRFSFKADGGEVDLRVSSLPTVHGEKIVMRLLKKSDKVPALTELGLRGRALKNLEDGILRPHGIILICGPTGSGKTTTLYSILSKVATIRINVMTIEDPVEYEIPGVNQVQVNPKAGLTFASAMRSFLRQDPNVILVGEIRDQETTELAVQASLTGHLVFSTLHTNTAAGAPPRLLDLGSEPFLLVSSLTTVVAQRILRRVCPACKEEFQPLPEVVVDLKSVLGNLYPQNQPVKLFKSKGCSECNSTGYYGRVGIFEVMPVSEKIGRLILEHSTAGAIEKQAVEEGMITMKQDGYLKVLAGLTTIEEVLRVAEE